MVRLGRKGEYAGIVSRGVALVIDVIVVTTCVLAINWLLSLPITFFFSTNIAECMATPPGARTPLRLVCSAVSIAWVIVPLVAAPIYFTFFFWTSGQTVGKYVMGLRVVRLDGSPMTLVSAIVRWFGYFVSTLPFGLGFLWVTVDSRRLALHDHLAHTCVIYSWKARGDEFTLDRVRAWFRRSRRGTEPAAPGGPRPAIAPASYDAVAVTVARYSEVEPVLDLIQSLVYRGKISVVSVTVLAKDAAGSIAIIGASDLSDGGRYANLPGMGMELDSPEIQRIKRELPADRFIILVLLPTRFAEPFVRAAGAVGRTLIGRYGLGGDPGRLTFPAPPH